MHKKLIVAAVAGTLAAPMAFADAPVAKWYGRVNSALSINDGLNLPTSNNPDEPYAGDDTVVQNVDVGSRFGVKARQDLGNGYSAIGRLEFHVFSNSSTIEDNNRQSFVGLTGSFGTVTLGRQWSAYFNHFGTYVDPWQSIGSTTYYRNGALFTRRSNTLKYANTVGPVSFGLDAVFDGEDSASNSGADAFGLGASADLGAGLTLGLAYDNRKEQGVVKPSGTRADRDLYGVALKWTGDPYWVSFGWGANDTGDGDKGNTYSLIGNARFGSNEFMAGVFNSEDDTRDQATGLRAVDETGFSFGVYHYVSDNFRLYIESAWLSRDNSPVGESDTISQTLLGMRFDF